MPAIYYLGLRNDFLSREMTTIIVGALALWMLFVEVKKKKKIFF